MAPSAVHSWLADLVRRPAVCLPGEPEVVVLAVHRWHARLAPAALNRFSCGSGSVAVRTPQLTAQMPQQPLLP